MFIGTPDLKCNPSVFWDTKCFTISFFNNVAINKWVKDGCALSTNLSIGVSWGFLIYFYFSSVLFHNPGPVFIIVSWPDL